jgi:hypothetical protein
MRYSIVAFVAAVVVTGNLVRAQTPPQPTPPAENLAAARELVQLMKAADNFKAVLPIIANNMKSRIGPIRPEVEERMLKAASARANEFGDRLAAIYAQHFTLDEIHQIASFYQTSVGQKLIAEQPAIAGETMALGQELGKAAQADALEQARKDEMLTDPQ